MFLNQMTLLTVHLMSSQNTVQAELVSFCCRTRFTCFKLQYMEAVFARLLSEQMLADLKKNKKSCN